MQRMIAMILLLPLLLAFGCTTKTEPEAPEMPAETAATMMTEAPAPVATALPEETPGQTAETAQEATETEAPATESESRFAPLYAKMQETGVLPEMMAMPAGMIADFYGIDPADCADSLYYISFDSMLCDEIVLIDAADAAAAKRVEKALEARLSVKADETRDYAPEQYAIVKTCRVTTTGLTVALIVSAEREMLTDLLEQFA